jgi:NadR type nicotinamide-nucleotide adenylyltransferase
MTTGMVLGKFMPPHAGHLHLVDFARAFVDDLTVVVGTLAREPIPGSLRHAWMRELFPDVRVVHLTDENPQDPSEHPEFWHIWRASLLRVLPHAPDYVFASDVYGAKLAEVLGARFVPVDPTRSAVPISGTLVRADPLVHWEHLPRPVRPYFVKRVCIFGPESTGKSTLARRLAAHFHTVHVPEFARSWLEAALGQVTREDMPLIARGQLAAEDALAREANRLLFCDTDALTTAIWSEALFGACDPRIRAHADERTYALHLLLDVDLPWVADPVRYLPNERRALFQRCEDALRRAGRPYAVIRGDGDARFHAAVAAVEGLGMRRFAPVAG